MIKSFGVYSVMWAISIAVFNGLVFFTPNEWGGFNKFGGAFWAGYIFITVAFVGHILCAFMAFFSKKKQKLFYKLPLFSISYAGLIITLVVGTVCMVVPDLSEWIAIVVCGVVLALNIIAVVRALAVAGAVSAIDKRRSTQAFFLKNLTVDAYGLVISAKTDELRAETKKVYEAIRYSDPMANAALSDIDIQLERQFIAFADAVKAEDSELAKVEAEAFIELITKRNQNCKLLK